MSNRYNNSEIFLERALQLIPLGSQTFSKSKTTLPYGVSPYFIDKGLGSKIWDLDGNEYIDFVSALCAITLGYQDKDVDNSVITQMKNGVTFSLPHSLETEVAQLIVDMVPSAEMVRFAKNGTDATSGAIRVARAYTGRDKVAVCGYHGWQDWYIGTTSRDLGIPNSVKELTYKFEYNNIDSLKNILEQNPGEFSAVILEPMNLEYPCENFLENVKELTHIHGALLIFDETITGFRFSIGGAQELFDVLPDLSTFGKGLANGFPLSALTGKKEYMSIVEDIFFSGTFGGETLSLAAAKAVLTKLRNEPILDMINKQGSLIIDGVNKIINDLKVNDLISISGHPSWSFIKFHSTELFTSLEIKTLFIQEVFKRGIYTLGTHNVTYAHSLSDVNLLLECYAQVFLLISESIKDNTLLSKLECKPIEPLFTVR
jgi:glutamate-1-semialdehyde 2,1-aminomutase